MTGWRPLPPHRTRRAPAGFLLCVLLCVEASLSLAHPPGSVFHHARGHVTRRQNRRGRPAAHTGLELPGSIKGKELAALEHRLRPKAGKRAAATQCDVAVGSAEKFKKVQDAVNSVGKTNAGAQVVICVRPGVYWEQVTIGLGQNGVVLVGEGPNTVIAMNKSLSQTGNTWTAGTLLVWGDKFQARNIMVQNTLITTKDPAPAVSLLSSSSSWDSVSLTGWQDTVGIYTGSGHRFINCFISGIVDITWGFGRAAFLDSTIYIRYLDKFTHGQVATYGTDQVASAGVPSGGLFWNCTIDGAGKTLLARPYRVESMAIFAYTFMGKAVMPEGYEDRRSYLTQKKYLYLEFLSWGPGAARSRSYGQVLEVAPPSQYTVANFLTKS